MPPGAGLKNPASLPQGAIIFGGKVRVSYLKWLIFEGRQILVNKLNSLSKKPKFSTSEGGGLLKFKFI